MRTTASRESAMQVCLIKVRAVKTIWTSRVYQSAAKYGDNAPMAAVCCNACRTCVTTNLVTLAAGAGLAALYGAGRLAKRVIRVA